MEMSEEELLAEFAPVLRRELEELRRLSRGTAQDRAPMTLDQQSVGRLARMDAMQMQAMALAAERRRQGRERRIVAALKRMDEGEFGYCVRCGGCIGVGRLRLDPAAALCVACAAEA